MTRASGRGWVRRPLDEIAEIIGGGTPSTKDPANFGGDIAWLTPKDLSDWRSRWIDRGSRNLTEQGLRTSSARLLPAKTVLVSSRAPIGYVALSAKPLTTNQGFRSLVLKKSHVPEFFYYVMRTMKPALEAAASGTTFKEISGSALKRVEVPVPPMEDQGAIATMLGALDEKIDSNRRLIRLLEALVTEEFARSCLRRTPDGDSWPTAHLGELGTVRGGGTPSTSVPEYWAEDGMVWLTPKDMTDLEAPVVYDSTRRISLAGLSHSSARALPRGTVLYTSRATLGVTAIACTEVSTNQGFITVETNAEFSPEFVLMLLRAKRDAIASRANGSTFLEVNKSNFKRIGFDLPPTSTRRSFDGLARPVFEWVESLDREARSLSQLRDALAPALVTGRLSLRADD